MAWEVDRRAASDGGQPPHGTIPRKAAGCMDQLAPRAVATMVSVRWDIAMGLIGCC